jgi:hypothetical protein
VKILQNIFLKFDDCSNQRENIVTEYAFFFKNIRILTNFHTQKNDAGGPPNTQEIPPTVLLYYISIYEP